MLVMRMLSPLAFGGRLIVTRQSLGLLANAQANPGGGKGVRIVGGSVFEPIPTLDTAANTAGQRQWANGNRPKPSRSGDQ
jgi:hypothetical protein